ncbi:anthranilate synthase component I family protein [Cryobacterium frigoriphilum]|uniref:Anthranilate synthase component I family protein n=1 Tax=Cryobacterium frigoriphilum TaxID=1259150 RepID=A0A4R9A3S9_9MICO|nr:anthranilate synthase component I family protein [Cryobacterium frigoriphilum]TFD51589.1 anthranilate synthase component I family protein [Cryobacterium frigoriphilum]
MSASIERERLREWHDPAVVFAALYGSDRYAVWLDAGPFAQTGVSYLGAASARSRFVTASVPTNTVTVCVPGDPGVPAVTMPGTIFDFLRSDSDARDADAESDSPVVNEQSHGFALGWVGWLGYELGAGAVGAPAHEARTTDAALLDLDRAIAFDHQSRTVTLLAREGVAAWAVEVQALLDAVPPVPPVPPSPSQPGLPASAARWRHGPRAYAKLIERCQAAIHAGDAYQLCLTNEISLDLHPDPAVVYARLRAENPSHHGGLLRFGTVSLLSSSPEQFLAVTRQGVVTTKPIKGTRSRGTDPERDRALRDELLASDKERAENLMIVDLMRNDLGRIARLGSVRVTTLLGVESYPAVHQLVSTIEARLAAGIRGIDAVEACFPAGSMTGAPKRSAMTLLDSLEGGARGIYAGAFGYLGHDGAIDLAMVIRSIVITPDGVSIGTGGGITALSDPAEEIEETRLKAAALLRALGVPPPPEPVSGSGMGNLEGWTARSHASA